MATMRHLPVTAHRVDARGETTADVILEVRRLDGHVEIFVVGDRTFRYRISHEAWNALKGV